MTTKVSIIVLTINSLGMVKEELENISKLNTSGLDLTCIVVDNGSTDGTEQELKDYKFKNKGKHSISYKYIQTGKNLGFAEGNNVGIRHALKNKADFILILNDDMILSDNLLTEMVSFMKSKPEAGIVSPKIYFAKNHEFHRSRYSESQKGKVIWYAGGKVDWDNIYTNHIGVDEIDNGQFDKITTIELASGACMLVKSEVFQKIGFFDNDLFLYWEDADFCMRARKSGYQIYFNPNTSAWHKVSASAGGSGSTSNDYYLIRNRYYFALRYAKLRTKFAVLRDTIKIAFAGREWQKKGAIDALLGRKEQGSWRKK